MDPDGVTQRDWEPPAESVLVQLPARALGPIEVREEARSSEGFQVVSLSFGVEGGGLVRVLGRRCDVHALMIEADRQLSRLMSAERGNP